MHNAPLVTYPVGRSTLYGWALGVVWLLSFACICIWCYQSDSVGWRQIWALTTLPLTGGFALQSWRTQASGELRWTGLGWLWLDAQQNQTEGEVAVILDWQLGLLLMFKPALSRGWWCWVAQHAHPLRWLDLRRALYSPDRMTSVSAPDALNSGMHNPP